MICEPINFVKERNAKKSANIQVRSSGAVYDEARGRIFWDISLPTLEGSQNLSEDSFICKGVNNELWQQPLSRIRKVYDLPKNADFSGWVVATAKPNAPEVEFMVNKDFTHVRGAWGSFVKEFGPNCQTCDPGDIICRSTTDHSDMWVVRRKMFFATYKLV